MTFDIEDWFHILDNESTNSPTEWMKYESRIHANMDRIFSLLEHSEAKGTFFCLGWIVAKYPDVIKNIIKYGYEVGCHSESHQLVYTLNPKEFKTLTFKAIARLQDLTGQPVTTYRAPGFSITPKTPWAFEILAEAGITHDSSIFPARSGHGGYPGFPANTPSIIRVNGVEVKEFPISSHSIAGISFVYSGGGYFRLFPYKLIKNFSQNRDYLMTYFHPRDFDPDQPMVPGLSPFRKFKSYYGLKNALPKLEKWLSEASFTDLRTADTMIDWTNVPIINISEMKT